MKRKQSFFEIDKKEGETPLECLSRLRAKHPELAGLPMTYAGRLDPMAEGVLIVLAGEECKNKDAYLRADKEYEIEALFGIGTDTGDILGIPGDITFDVQNLEISSHDLKSFKGKFVQQYPIWSSKTVKGKPLFSYARGFGGEALPEEMPKKRVEIYEIEMQGGTRINAQDLLQKVLTRIARVKGDFRQDEIAALWTKTLQNIETEFPIAKIRVFCSSGTYMRVLVQKIGEKFGLPALAWRIVRTRIVR